MRHLAIRIAVAILVVVSSGAGVLLGGPLSVSHATAAGTLAVDTLVTTHQTSVGSSITSPPFTTSQGGELVIAFVSSDGPFSAP